MSVFSELTERINKLVLAEAQQAGQLTLGEFVDLIRHLPPDMPVRLDFIDAAPGEFMSYRGYYDHISMDSSDSSSSVGDLQNRALAALGATMHGYKGGDFVMHRGVPVWVAEYGRSDGRRVVGLRAEASHVVIQTAEPAP